MKAQADLMVEMEGTSAKQTERLSVWPHLAPADVWLPTFQQSPPLVSTVLPK